MKKNLLLILTLLFIGSVSAQTTVPNGGTGITSVANMSLVAGSSTLRLQAISTSTLASWLNLSSYSTPSIGSQGYIQFASSTAGYFDATSTLFWDPVNFKLGVGSSSPGARLSVRGLGFTTGVNFQTTSANNTPLFSILDSGNVGVNTINPVSKLTIYDDTSGDVSFLTLRHATNYGADLGINTNMTGDFFVQTVIAGTPTKRLTIQRADGNVGIGTTSPAAKLDVWGNFNVGTSSTPTLFVNTATGNVGIGTSTPGAFLHVLGTTEQVRIGYDASNYASLTASSTGLLSVGNNGTNYFNIGKSGTVDSQITFPALGGASAASGGILNITGQAAGTLSGNNAGGAVTITGGTPRGLGVGGAINLRGGSGSTDGVGGAINITGGTGTNNSNGGAIVLTTGTSGSGAGNSNGGDLTMSTSAGRGNGRGGNFSVTTGASSSGGVSGSISFTVSNGVGGSQGSNVSFTAGTAGGSANVGLAGGATTFTSGTGGNGNSVGGMGGAVTLNSGGGGFTNGSGQVTSTSGSGADISLTAGSAGNAVGAAATTGAVLSGNGGGVTFVTGNGGSASGVAASSYTGGNSGALTFRTGAAGTGATANGTVGSILFQTAGANTRMVISGVGNVGIGTTTPGALLTIASTTLAGASPIINFASSSPVFGVDSDGSAWFCNSAGTVGQVLKSNGSTACPTWVATSTLGLGGGGSGTVTSVDMTVPTGLSISGNPVTTSGTLALALAAGYNIPLTASTTNWNSFWDTPSTRITAGTGLSWTGNTLNAAAITFVDSETPSGTINSSNVTFTLANTPTAGSVHLYLNGQRLAAGGVDYTLSTATITFVTAPPTGSIMLADYRR